MSQHGPAPGSRCTVCRHARAREADNMLRNGKTVASVARFLGMARRDPVDRHIRSGHVAPVAAGVAPEPAGGATVAIPTGNPNAAPVDVLRAALDDLRGMDTSKMSHAAQTMRLDAIRRSAESLGKLEPPPRAETMTYDDFKRVVVSENGATMEQLIEAWFLALEPWPEAIAAFGDATTRLLGDRATISAGKEERT